MEESIIIELHVRPEILINYAKIIKHECEKYEICDECPMHRPYKDFPKPTCPFMCANNPTEWTLD